MHTRRMTFTKGHKPMYGNVFQRDHGRQFLCTQGLREWFSVPYDISEVDLVLTSAPTPHSYLVKFRPPNDGFQSTTPLFFRAEGEDVPAPSLARVVAKSMHTFHQKHGACYVGVEA